MKRKEEELYELVDESIGLLRRRARDYDEGNAVEAKIMATIIAILVYDTSRSHAVLELLQIRQSMKWLTTAAPINPQNILPSWGPVTLKISNVPGQKPAEWVAMLDESRYKAWITFDDWWETAVIKTDQDELWSRCDLVKELRNKQGGAHIDPRVSQKYTRLLQKYSLGSLHIDIDGKSHDIQNNLVYAAVRQITYELITSLDVFPRIPHSPLQST